MPTITSVTNPRIKNVARLQMQARHRRQRGLFCIESAREMSRALDAGFRAAELYVCESMFDDRDLIDRIHATGPAFDTVTPVVLEKIAYRENPAGFVAVMESRTASLDDVARTGDELFVVCSGLEKPGNVGAIVRSAEAAGVAAVLVDNPTADVFNPHCIRASMGGVFAMPMVTGEADDLVAALRGRGARLVAVSPDSGQRYTDADLTGTVALVLGAESVGLSGAWRQACGAAVSIPMRGNVDSINVSVAAAVVMFESRRQRDARA